MPPRCAEVVAARALEEGRAGDVDVRPRPLAGELLAGTRRRAPGRAWPQVGRVLHVGEDASRRSGGSAGASGTATRGRRSPRRPRRSRRATRRRSRRRPRRGRRARRSIAPVSVARSSDVRRALLARVPERVGEHEPALGVGVRDLDRLAVRGREDVARAGTRRRSACSRSAATTVERRAAGSPSSAIAPDACDHGRAAGHVALHVLHVQRRLERDPAGVERDRLADEPEHDVGACRRPAGRSAARSGAAGCALPCATAANAPMPSCVNLVGAERLGGQVLERRRDLLRALRQPLGRELVRRAVRRGRGRGSSTPRPSPRVRPPPPRPSRLAEQDERGELRLARSSCFQRAGS